MYTYTNVRVCVCVYVYINIYIYMYTYIWPMSSNLSRHVHGEQIGCDSATRALFEPQFFLRSTFPDPLSNTEGVLELPPRV